MSDDSERYARASHAMMSGVKAEQESGSNDGTPKHLRCGVNSALVNDAALVRLLIEKGIITEEEYVKAVADEMEREVERYQERLTRRFGYQVRLA